MDAHEKNRRIIYILKPFSFPSGGVATIYDHVEILSNHGFQAFVALETTPDKDFYNSNAPLMIHGGKINFQAGDIYVFPEGLTDYMEAFKNISVRKIMFCQNQYYLPFSANPNLGFSEYPVDDLVISSKAIESFMQKVYGLSNISLIPYSIDTRIFFPEEKKRQIAYMPWKLPNAAKFIEAAFKRIYKEYQDISWVSISGMNREHAAKILRESAVFLSLSHRESFGLPPLEAMASGCLVAGFHGDGGREYMNQNNGWWAEDGDWLTCVNGLASAIQIIDTKHEEINKIKKEMEITVDSYSRAIMIERLIQYWEEQVKTPISN